MKIFFILIYNFILYPLLFVTAFIGTLFHKKLREGMKGKRATIALMKDYFSKNQSGPVYWFHAASHGEYLQTKQVISGLKEVEPSSTIIASFFSPSGYNNVDDPNIDLKVYIPFDFIWSVRRMLKIAQPKKIMFAAYDIWPNLIWTAYYRKIPTTLFAAHFVKGTNKLKPIIRSFYRTVYESISSIYTVNGDDYLMLQQIVRPYHGPTIRVLGNPRYDEVKNLANEFTQKRTISVLLRERRLVIGSVWPEDQNVILSPILRLLKEYPDLRILWVPHEPTEKYINEGKLLFESEGFDVSIFRSKRASIISASRVVIVGVIGVLSKLYWDGQFAYVGGGFSTGVHNVMEPAIARLPVLFGPKNENSHEAQELIENGGGKSISTSDEFYHEMKFLLDDTNAFLKASYAATDVIHQNLGSSTRVVRGILRD